MSLLLEIKFYLRKYKYALIELLLNIRRVYKDAQYMQLVVNASMNKVLCRVKEYSPLWLGFVCL